MKRILGIALMVGALALMAAPKAEAALVGSFHVCQVGVGCTDFAGDGFGPTTVGDYTVQGTGAHLQNSAIGQTSNTNIQIFRTNPGTGSAGALEVWYTVTGYTLPVGTQFVMDTTASASKTGVATDIVSYFAWYSASNSTGFPTGILGGSGQCAPPVGATAGTTTSCSGDGPTTPVGAGSALYSLISRTTFNISVGNASIFASTGQAAVSAVPEPGTMVLFGAGLVGMATMLRRRSAKQ